MTDSATSSSAGSILTSLLKKYKLEDRIQKYDFVTRWDEIVGPELARRMKPECFRRDVLVIAVQNAAWAQELSFNKLMILQKLKDAQSTFGLPDINDIVFYVAGER